jgi:hypothetical protein
LFSGVQIIVFWSDSPVASGVRPSGETVDAAKGAARQTAIAAAKNAEAEQLKFKSWGEFRGEMTYRGTLRL